MHAHRRAQMYTRARTRTQTIATARTQDYSRSCWLVPLPRMQCSSPMTAEALLPVAAWGFIVDDLPLRLLGVQPLRLLVTSCSGCWRLTSQAVVG